MLAAAMEASMEEERARQERARAEAHACGHARQARVRPRRVQYREARVCCRCTSRHVIHTRQTRTTDLRAACLAVRRS